MLLRGWRPVHDSCFGRHLCQSSRIDIWHAVSGTILRCSDDQPKIQAHGESIQYTPESSALHPRYKPDLLGEHLPYINRAACPTSISKRPLSYFKVRACYSLTLTAKLDMDDEWPVPMCIVNPAEGNEALLFRWKHINMDIRGGKCRYTTTPRLNNTSRSHRN